MTIYTENGKVDVPAGGGTSCDPNLDVTCSTQSDPGIGVAAMFTIDRCPQ